MNKLFLLLKEYQDKDVSHSSDYIQTYTDIMSIKKYLKNIADVLEFFNYEQKLIYYDSKNITSFFYPMDCIPDVYPNGKDYFRSLIKVAGLTDWRKCTGVNNQDIDILFENVSIKDDTLSRLFLLREDSDSSYLILDANAINKNDKDIVLVDKVSGKEFHFFHCQCNVKAIYQWFLKNRKPQRCFSQNNKHGLSGKGAKKLPNGTFAAQLLCSCSEALILLTKAVGDSVDGELYFFDKSNNEYICFRNERTGNLSFHGYHLKSGKKGYDKIPKDKIKQIIEFNID